MPGTYKSDERDWEKILTEVESKIREGIIPPSVNAIANAYDIPSASVYRNLKKLRGMGAHDLKAWAKNETDENLKFLEIDERRDNGDRYSKKLLEITSEDLKSDDRLLELHGLDPKIFKIKNCTNNYWNGIENIEKGGNIIMLRQSKLLAELKTVDGLTFEDIDEFFKNYKGFEPPRVTKRKVDKSDDVLEINLADMHIAKRGIYENEKTIFEKVVYTIEDIKKRINGRKFSKIYLTSGGDLSHFDGVKPFTTGGTLLDTDGMTFKEAYDLALEIFIYVIEQLEPFGPVEYIEVDGNHDRAFSYYLAKGLEIWFRNNKNVEVDASHISRKFRKIGIAVVGWCHFMAKKNIHDWLQVEAREYWSETTVAEVHAFHFHSQTTTEKGGVIVRHLPSMTSTDDWHYQKGYVGAQKATACFLWGLEKGLKEIWYTNV